MLKLDYAKKDDIPEKYLALYTEKDGKFILTEIDGMKTQTDIDNVKEATRKERELKKAAEAKLAAYSGIDSDGLQDNLDELARLRLTKGTVDNTKLDEMVADRLRLDKAKHERDLETVNTKLTASEATNTTLVNEKNTTVIEKSLRDAGKGKVNESAMNDVIFRASLFEVSEDGKVLTRDGVGVTPGQEPSQWLDDTLKANEHWQTTTSGVGARGNTGGSSRPPANGEPQTFKEILEESCTFND
jgi:hypothetical protein